MQRRYWLVGAAALAALLLLLCALPVRGLEAVDPVPPAARPRLPTVAASSAPVTPSGPVQVACPMVTWGPSTREHVPVLVFTDDSDTETKWLPGTVDEAWLEFTAPTVEGAGLVTLRGHKAAGVVWWTRDNGETECHFPDIPSLLEKAQFRTAVPELVDGETVYIQVCEDVTPTMRTCVTHTAYAMDRELTFVVDAGTWTTQICRSWGDLTVCREPQDQLLEGDVSGDIDWPDAPAGTGIETLTIEVGDTIGRPTPDGWVQAVATEAEAGVFVTRVVPGSPGQLAGVRAGDVIDDLFGDLPDVRPRGFHDLAPGSDGEQVIVRIRGQDGEREVAITLEKITGAL